MRTTVSTRTPIYRHHLGADRYESAATRPTAIATTYVWLGRTIRPSSACLAVEVGAAVSTNDLWAVAFAGRTAAEALG